MRRQLHDYRTLIFDCDGVLLDSNRVKTEAFRFAASAYGESVASQLVEYHKANGGISRYQKFDWMLKQLVPTGTVGPGTAELLDAFATAVSRGLVECDMVEGLTELRAATRGARWLVVSGGDQCELRSIFAQRGISKYFDGGIFGSPDSKEDILAREIGAGNLRQPALFFGDSRYDHAAARQFDIDFLFVSGWSEFHGWQDYCAYHGIGVIEKLPDVLHLPREVVHK